MSNELKQHAIEIYNIMSNVPKTEEGGKLALEYIEDKLETAVIIGEIKAIREMTDKVKEPIK